MSSNVYDVTSTAMKGEGNRMETITENLANNVMPGYRKSFPTQQPFEQVLNNAKTYQGSAAVDFTAGPVKETGNPLDFAITGEGFFTVAKDGKEFYTRNGHFTVSPTGVLKSDSGLNVRGANNNDIMVPKTTDMSKLTTRYLEFV